MKAYEVNFDGLVGPTHNYSGLSYGNVASTQSQGKIANPREAALQGLHKMHMLAKMGIKQAILPPHERPYLPILRELGFSGSPSEMLLQVKKSFRSLYEGCCSAAPMWVANAATVAPSSDTADQKVHFTPANLSNKFHRAVEAVTTSKVLKAIFADPRYFVHHPPLPTGTFFSDEGAANHTRFCHTYESPGIHLFVYGKSGFHALPAEPHRFPARQTLEASQAIARLHQLNPAHVLFAQQNPTAIDAGVFHNDVISVGNQTLFLYHEEAFVDTESLIQQLRNKVEKICKQELCLIKVSAKQVSLAEAVQSYLFNSQILTLPDHSIRMIAPQECQHIPAVANFLQEMLQSSANPIAAIDYLDLKQSMQNGGGPACLRLRVVLNTQELDAVNPHVFLTDQLYEELVMWIQKHYRTQLSIDDLADPQLIEEDQTALDALTKILKLGSLYSFQR